MFVYMFFFTLSQWWKAQFCVQKKGVSALIVEGWGRNALIKRDVWRHAIYEYVCQIYHVCLTGVRFIYYECDATFHVRNWNRFGSEYTTAIRYNFNHWYCCINMQMNSGYKYHCSYKFTFQNFGCANKLNSCDIRIQSSMFLYSYVLQIVASIRISECCSRRLLLPILWMV